MRWERVGSVGVWECGSVGVWECGETRGTREIGEIGEIGEQLLTFPTFPTFPTLAKGVLYPNENCDLGEQFQGNLEIAHLT